ncbi:MAG TPA: MmcQ/YjbR family DNA-binding protein [Candidatus Dormibacteraeota bacterium]|nr:MmcQ/YjbR family DNA-binding protein [Candidatus Dormibacteraeota bacterium]
MIDSNSNNIITEYLTNHKNVKKSQPFEKNIDLYTINDQMFALVNNRNPIILSLRCDKVLSKFLQEKYESVMPGQKLDQDKWISIVNSGQVPINEIKDLITLSYNIANGIV